MSRSIFLLNLTVLAHPPKEKYLVNKKNRVHLLARFIVVGSIFYAWPRWWWRDGEEGAGYGTDGGAGARGRPPCTVHHIAYEIKAKGL